MKKRKSLSKFLVAICCAIMIFAGAMFIMPQNAQAVYAETTSYTEITTSTAIGSEISFGGRTWNLLSYDDTNKRALLLSSVTVTKMAFGTSTTYEGSAVQTYLNGTFYNSLTDKDKILPIAIDATNYSTDVTTYAIGTNYCFLLSYQDVFGSGASEAINTQSERKRCESGSISPDWWWLRSKDSTLPSIWVAGVSNDGSSGCQPPSDFTTGAVVPALYVSTVSSQGGTTPSTGVYFDNSAMLISGGVMIACFGTLAILFIKRKKFTEK